MRSKKYYLESYEKNDEVTIGRIYTIRRISYSKDYNRVIEHYYRPNYKYNGAKAMTVLYGKTYEECYEFVMERLKGNAECVEEES